MRMTWICDLLKKSFSATAVCGLLVFLCSCGYQAGSLMHPQIRTVAVADVKNETMEVEGSPLLRGILAERFQFDNSLKITTPDKADCIVYAKIVSVDTQNIVWHSEDDDKTFRPSLFRLTAEVEYTVRVPGQAKPLVPSGKARANATYQLTHDPALGKRDALKQAFLQISDKIVHAVTEGW